MAVPVYKDSKNCAVIESHCSGLSPEGPFVHHNEPDINSTGYPDRPLLSRRLFAGTLVAAAISGIFHPFLSKSAFADPTSAEKQAEADEVRKKLDGWAAELNQASDRYYQALEVHETAIAAMNEAQGRIEIAEAELARLQNKLGSRMVSMYKQGQLGFLEVIFGAHSFYEFTSTWDLLSNMNDDDATLIEQSKAAKLEAQTARDDFANYERLAREKLAEAEEIKAKAELIVADYEAELASLEEEVAALIQKEREEEERRQREAAAEEMRKNNGGAGWGDGIPVFTGGVTEMICQAAISRLGCPYIWAAAGPNTFDCSGLTQWCYNQAGVYIAHQSEVQRANATSVLPVSEAIAGDILWKDGHVGIYMGGGAYIHAPEQGDVVRYGYNMGQWSNACRY